MNLYAYREGLDWYNLTALMIEHDSLMPVASTDPDYDDDGDDWYCLVIVFYDD